MASAPLPGMRPPSPPGFRFPVPFEVIELQPSYSRNERNVLEEATSSKIPWLLRRLVDLGVIPDTDVLLPERAMERLIKAIEDAEQAGDDPAVIEELQRLHQMPCVFNDKSDIRAAPQCDPDGGRRRRKVVIFSEFQRALELVAMTLARYQIRHGRYFAASLSGAGYMDATLQE